MRADKYKSNAVIRGLFENCPIIACNIYTSTARESFFYAVII